jgi:hypothetical protein
MSQANATIDDSHVLRERLRELGQRVSELRGRL